MTTMNPFTVQEHYRIRDDTTAADPGTPNWITTEDQSASETIATDTTFRIRFVVANTGDANANSPYQLFVSKNGGSYGAVTTSSTGGAQSADAGSSADALALTAGNFQLTAGTGSAVNGEYDETGEVDANLGGGDYNELEFGVTIPAADVADADTLDFRVYYNGAAMDQYDANTTPRIIVSETVSNVGSSAGTSAVQGVSGSVGSAAGTSTATGISLVVSDYPTVRSSDVWSSGASASASHVVDLPADIVADDLLLMLFACDLNGQTFTEPSGWEAVNLFDEDASATSHIVGFWKKASGSEGATATVGISSSAVASAITFSIKDWDTATTPEASSFGTVTASTSWNPPSETASWGADKNLWIAFAAQDQDGSPLAISGYPTNFDDNQLAVDPASGIQAAVATREYDATDTQDPGVFTGELDQYNSATVVVRVVQVVGNVGSAAGTSAVTGLSGSPASSVGTSAAAAQSASVAAAAGASSAAALSGAAASAAGVAAITGYSGSVGASAGIATVTAVTMITGSGSAAGTSAVQGYSASIGAVAGLAAVEGKSGFIASAAGLASVQAYSGSIGQSAGTSAVDGQALTDENVGSAAGTSTAQGFSASLASSAGVATTSAKSGSAGSSAGTSVVDGQALVGNNVGSAAGTSSVQGYSASRASSAGVAATQALSGSLAASAGAAAAVAKSGSLASSAGSATAAAKSGSKGASAGLATVTGLPKIAVPHTGSAAGTSAVTGYSASIGSSVGVSAIAGLSGVLGSVAGASTAAATSVFVADSSKQTTHVISATFDGTHAVKARFDTAHSIDVVFHPIKEVA